MQQQKKPEILAPCGNAESVKAAIACGANAVYLGQQNFNARKNASNFDRDLLRETVSECHLYGVKVYQTLNTLVFDHEFDLLKRCISDGCEAGIDAFIVQDMGVISLLQTVAPTVPIHASTQMTIHTPEGARFLEKSGIKRVVLARELSLEEIKEIRNETEIELEVFVHGALCVCVSGQCYMSAMLGGRSGNRGTCAQPCRLPFSINNDGAPDLSLKDLSAISELERLADLGVCSFKIEGRMKRPEYVAAAVTACVQKLRGESPDIATLQAVFSRSGFTNGYLLGQRDRSMFGNRQKADVVAANEVLKPLQQLYHKPIGRVSCEMDFCVKAGEPVSLQMTDEDGNVAFSKGEIPEHASFRAVSKEILEQSFGRLGGTPFYLRRITGTVEDGLFCSMKSLNDLRRRCVEQLSNERRKILSNRYCDAPVLLSQTTQSSKQKLRIRAEVFEQIEPFLEHYDIILPLEEGIKHAKLLQGKQTILELPRVYFGAEKKLIFQIKEAIQCGFHRVLIQNVGQIPVCNELGLEISGGFGLNITNSYALNFYQQYGLKDATLSVEMNLEDAKRIQKGIPIGCIAYGKLPLMITRSCPIGKYKSCDQCSRTGILTDRTKKQFTVRCHDGVREIYNPDLLYLADRIQEFSCFDFLTIWLTNEPPKEVKAVISEYENGKGKREKLTRGLYYRKV